MKNHRMGTILLFLWVLVYWLFAHDYVRYNYFHEVEYQRTIEKYAKQNGLRPEFVAAVIYTESRFQPEAQSHIGAMGLMQIMPDTAAWVAKEQGTKVQNLNEPEENIRIGTWYLRDLYQSYRVPVLVLAAYNAGRGHVDEWIRQYDWKERVPAIEEIPFPETREFIRSVQKYEEVYRDKF